MRHGRLRNILAAGALTGLVLATMLAFVWQSKASEPQPVTVDASGTDALRIENEQLRQALDTLQQREAAYQSQIEAANQTILKLQAAGDSASVNFKEDDDEWEEREHEEDEYEEDEHEEDEHEEHEREHDDD